MTIRDLISFRKITANMLMLVLITATIPTRAQENTQAESQEKRKPSNREVIYGHKDGLAMTYDVFQAGGKANGAAVVFIVSGGWVSKWTPPEQTRFVLAPFLAKGYTGFAVRHGSSPRYSIAEALADTRRAIRHIKKNAEEYGVAADRVGVFGMSAGGHLTLMLATTGDDGDTRSADPLAQTSSRIRAGVALVPPSNITPYVWSTPNLHPQYLEFPGLNISREEARKLSPLYFVTKDDAPCLIISGAKDTLVPPEQGEWIHEKMQEIGVQNKFVLYEKSGHALSRDMMRAVEESLNWFEKHLLIGE
ncbi:MAG: alpha/beta hydrolase [Planctomycetota bacterium]